MATLELYVTKGHFEVQNRQGSNWSPAVKWSKVFIKAWWPIYFLHVFLTKAMDSAAVPTIRQYVVQTSFHGSVGQSRDDQGHSLWGNSCGWTLVFHEVPSEIRRQKWPSESWPCCFRPLIVALHGDRISVYPRNLLSLMDQCSLAAMVGVNYISSSFIFLLR